MNDHDLDLDNEPMSNINMPIESPNTTSYLMTIVMLPLALTIYEIFTNQIYTKSFTLKMKVKVKDVFINW